MTEAKKTLRGKSKDMAIDGFHVTPGYIETYSGGSTAIRVNFTSGVEDYIVPVDIMKILSSIPIQDELISVEKTDFDLNIATDTMESNVSLIQKEYPTLRFPTKQWIQFPKKLSEAIQEVKSCMLKGIYFGKEKLISTNKYEAKIVNVKTGINKEFILDENLVKLLTKGNPPKWWAFDKDNVAFKFESGTMYLGKCYFKSEKDIKYFYDWVSYIELLDSNITKNKVENFPALPARFLEVLSRHDNIQSSFPGEYKYVDIEVKDKEIKIRSKTKTISGMVDTFGIECNGEFKFRITPNRFIKTIKFDESFRLSKKYNCLYVKKDNIEYTTVVNYL